MIIFGWRTIAKFLGLVFKKKCDHCHNEDYWTLTKSTKWFTLFFIPAIPLSSKYFLACPVCKYGFTLNDEQIKMFKPLAEVNQLLIDKKITQEEHDARLKQLNGQIVTEVEAEVAHPVTLSKEEGNGGYCANCGSKLGVGSQYCGNCGTVVGTAK